MTSCNKTSLYTLDACFAVLKRINTRILTRKTQVLEVAIIFLPYTARFVIHIDEKSSQVAWRRILKQQE